MVIGSIACSSQFLDDNRLPQHRHRRAPSGQNVRQASHWVPAMRVPQARQTSASLGMLLRQAGQGLCSKEAWEGRAAGNGGCCMARVSHSSLLAGIQSEGPNHLHRLKRTMLRLNPFSGQFGITRHGVWTVRMSSVI